MFFGEHGKSARESSKKTVFVQLFPQTNNAPGFFFAHAVIASKAFDGKEIVEIVEEQGDKFLFHEKSKNVCGVKVKRELKNQFFPKKSSARLIALS